MTDIEEQEDYEVRIGSFNGPMDLLLYLVQKKEMSLDQIPIAEIADDFLMWVNKIGVTDLSKAGDFLYMASRLMALKVQELLPGKEIVIGRPEEITVVYYNDEFNYEDNKLMGVGASLFDQQAQILDGVLPSELGLVSDIELDGKIEESDLAEIIPFYKDTFLPNRLEHLNKIIAADKDAAKDFQQLKFTEGVINGRITVVEPGTETAKRAKAKKAANKAIISAGKAERAANKAQFRRFINSTNKKSYK